MYSIVIYSVLFYYYIKIIKMIKIINNNDDNR